MKCRDRARFFAKLALLLATLAVCLPHAVAAGDLPTAPVLRVEIGTHSAPVNAVASDAAGRLLATVSFDRTVRLWSAATGALLRVMRPPVGAGDEGAMYTVALSPDGKTAAVAGWTGSWDDDWSVYLFDTDSGTLVRRVSGLPKRCVNLALSADGTRLAAAMKGGAGIRVYDSATLEVVFRDEAYDDDAVWMDFASDGRLAVTSLDGRIRLYDPAGKRLAARPGTAGKTPYGVKFSPDGRQLAIGYLDGPKVEVLDGQSLAPLFVPNLRGADNGFLQQVAWSRDGRTLFAGGSYERGGKTPIRRWDEGGRGRPRDFPVATKRVMQMAALPDGRLAWVAADPAMGVLDAAGKAAFEQRPPVGDFRGMADSFRVSADGATVAFGFAPWGEQPARFSLTRHALTLDPKDDDPSLRPPRLDAPGLKVEGWQNDLRDWGTRQMPVLNGKPVAMLPHETAMSLALSGDGRSFVLGTGYRIARFDAEGKLLWAFTPPGEALALNIAAGDRLVVAALGDGTIRWYRMADGTERLALFALADGSRWVAWTPGGDYMASVHGDTLVGWHVNRGKDKESAFHSIARFRKLHYRPDAVTRALAPDAGPAATPRAAAKSAAEMPPHVTIVSHDGEETFSRPTVTVRFRLEAPHGATVTKVHVRANGRPAGDLEARIEVPPGGIEDSVAIELPRRDSVVEVLAETAAGITSEPARVRFAWRGSQTAPAPKLYLLAIGISAYRAEALRLGLAAKDAEDFHAVVARRTADQYAGIEARILSDGKADLAGVRAGLDWLKSAPGSHDIAMVFLAGHGVDDESGRYYFVPQDADPAAMATTALPYEELRQALSGVRGRVFFFIDTCKSGAVWGKAGDAPPVDVGRVVNDLKSPEHGVVVFASSTGKQFSLEKPEWGNGAFTKAVVEGLDGKADLFGDGAVTVTSLDAYVSNRVRRLTDGRQTPATGKPVGPDFRLVTLR